MTYAWLRCVGRCGEEFMELIRLQVSLMQS